MALTATEKAQIRLYLGYPSLWRYKNTRLESVLDDNLDDEALVLVRSALVSLVAVEARLLATALTAGTKRVDEIWFFQASAARTELQALGKTYVARLSITTGVPIYSNVFGQSGYLGDSFSAGGEFGHSQGRGGFIPLG